MANSDIDICAQALIKLGSDPIQSFDVDQEGDKATTCANLYPNFRLAALTFHRWRFAMAKQALNLVVGTPVSEWERIFQLPADRAAPPAAVFNSSSAGVSPLTTGWEIFGDKLFTNENQIFVDYHQNIPESAWPPYFEIFAVDWFSARIAIPITDQVNMRSAMLEDTFGPSGQPELGSFSQAKRLDGQHNATNTINTASPLVIARLGGRGGGGGRGLVSS